MTISSQYCHGLSQYTTTLNGWLCQMRHFGVDTAAWRRSVLVPEVADAAEHHGDTGRVGGGDDLGVAHRSPRLDHRCYPGGDCGFEPIGERKECIRCQHCAAGGRERQPCRLACFLGFPDCDAHAVDATHLAGTD